MDEELIQDIEEEISESLIDLVINTGPKILLTILVFFVVIKLLNLAVKRFQAYMTKKSERNGDSERSKRVVTLSGILRSTLTVATYVTFTMILLSQLGINIAPLIAGVGIIGLAIGFGSQELVRDVITGFFMILENQIRVGDLVSINGTAGRVEKIEIRTVVLRDFSGEVHIFQNSKINNLTNKTKDWSAVVFDIRVSYQEDPEKVIEVIKHVGVELQKDPVFKPIILEPIEVVGLDRFGESEIVIKSRIKTKPGAHNKTGREFRKRLKYAFDHHNIKNPYPHRTVYFKNEFERTVGK